MDNSAAVSLNGKAYMYVETIWSSCHLLVHMVQSVVPARVSQHIENCIYTTSGTEKKEWFKVVRATHICFLNTSQKE